MSEIEWRDVPGYEGEYKVSSDGRVYSIPRVVMMKNGTRKTIRGKMLSPGIVGHGYLSVHLRGTEHEYIHRIVAKAFLGDFSETFEVNHKDENKHNNHVSNLEWVTRRENLDYGARNEKSKLSGMKYAKQIVAIRDGKVCRNLNHFERRTGPGFRGNTSAATAEAKQSSTTSMFGVFKTPVATRGIEDMPTPSLRRQRGGRNELLHIL